MAPNNVSRSDRKPVVTRNNDRVSDTGRNKVSNGTDKNTQGNKNAEASSASTATNQSYYQDGFQRSRTDKTAPKPTSKQNSATSQVNLKDFDYKGPLKSEPVFEGNLNGKQVKVTAPLAKTAPADDPRLDNVKYFSHETTAEGFIAQAKSNAVVAGSILRKTGVLSDSKKADDRGGGGSYVYTRVVTDKAPAVVGKGSTGSSMPVMLLMNKDLARRADMWSTSMDRYGKLPTIQDDTHGQDTDAARNTIKSMKNAAPIGNETGFYGAVSYKDVEHVVVKGKTQKDAEKNFDKVVGDVFDNNLEPSLKETTGKEMEELFSYAITGDRVKDLPKRDAADRIAQLRDQRGLPSNNPAIAPEDARNNSVIAPSDRGIPSTPSSSKNKVGVENNGVKAQAYQGEFDVGVAVAKAETTFGDPNGPVSGSAKVEALSANASGEASAGVDLSKGTAYAKGEVEASVNVVNAEAQVKTDYGVGNTEVAAKANVGASVEAEAEVNVDPLKGTVTAEVGGEAFTGAKASGEISQTVGPATATVGGEVMAGVGVEFEADVGLKDGKFSAKFDIGASLGIGASVEFGVEIDVAEAVETVKEVGETVVEGIKDVGEGIKNFFSGW
jgi:hypothetical protein